jgi:lipoate-protein ligase A
MILIKSNYENKELEPYFYFGLEEYCSKYLMPKFDEGMFFTWKIKGIVIGRFQVLESEVNLDYVNNNNIKIFRRPSGGGAVYADSNNTMFSIIVKNNQTFSFKNELSNVSNALNKTGLNTYLSTRNDILIDEQKISGNSFYRVETNMVLHGTLIYNLDVNCMSKCLIPKNKNFDSKAVPSVKSRVTNLISHTNLKESELIEGLTNNLNINYVYTLSKDEEQIVKELGKKYSQKEFIYNKKIPFTYKVSKTFSFGTIEIIIDVKLGIIDKLEIKGDFFLLKELDPIFESFSNSVFDLEEIKAKLLELNIGNYFYLGSTDEIITIFN